MAPTLNAGDWLVAIRRGVARYGALVMVEHPDRPGYEMVKRVAAMPGDRVGECIMGADEYWVTGDNPTGSTDSRSFGPVNRGAIRGRVVLRYWPVRRAAWLS